MIPDSLAPIANHLWQSTVFAAAAALLTLALRKNSARVRHSVWVAASLKFLVPFSVLIAIGGGLEWQPARTAIAPTVSVAVRQVSQPFTDLTISSPLFDARPQAPGRLPAILFGMWACGFIGLCISWCVRWRRIRLAVRTATPIPLDAPIKAVCSPTFPEPGVFGVLRPVLLVPEGLIGNLTPEQWKTVVAHELCHVRRRDNLVGVFQMFVETAFWFHPLVWWLGTKIVEERERACDEQVLLNGNSPRIYAEGILRICRLCPGVASASAAGISGANLKQRIENILAARPGFALNAARKALLSSAALLAVAAPVFIGITSPPSVRAQSKSPKTASFEVASIKPHPPGNPRVGFPVFLPGGRFESHAPIRILMSTALNLPFNNNGRLTGLPDWTKSEDSLYDVEATGVIPRGLSDEARQDLMRAMVVSLLQDRFKMKYHLVTKEMPVYALVVAKGGPKLQKAEISEKECEAVTPSDAPPAPGMTPQTCHTFNGGQGRGLHARAAGMTDLVHFVENWTGRPLLDKTGLKGLYQFNTKGWIPLQVGPPPDPGSKSEDGGFVADQPTLFQIFDQMGLKMEAQKDRVDIVVIDHLERPTEN